MSNEHYFAAQPASELNLRTFHARLAGQVYELTTASGIFSPERVDAGTEVLLANTSQPHRPAETCSTSAAAGDRSPSVSPSHHLMRRCGPWM